MLNRYIKNIFIFLFIISASNSFAACLSSNINNLRDNALTLYKSGDVKAAEQTLTQYYENECGYYEMSKGSDVELNRGLWLISDLMFYRQKSDDQLNCLSLYDDVYHTWMVSDENRYDKKVNRALKANYKQCKSALDKLYVEGQTCPISGYENMLELPNSWKSQDDLYYEVLCLRVIENSGIKRDKDRDGPKKVSEGLSDILKLEVLYTEQVTKENGGYWDWKNNPNGLTWEEFDAQGWLPIYKVNELYFVTDKNELFRTGYCYNLKPKFGKLAGEMYFDGSSWPCNGGASGYLDRMLVTLDFPIKATINQIVKSTLK